MKAHIRKTGNPVHPNSIVGEVLRLYEDMDVFLKRYSSAECANSCHECCHDYFYIGLKEFFTIVHHCIDNKPTDYLKTIIKSAKQQMDTIKSIYPEEYARLNETFTRRAMTSEQLKDFDDHKYIKEPLPEPCVFFNLTSGKCDIYEVRPYICRLFGSAYSSKQILFKQPLCEYVDSTTLADIQQFDLNRLGQLDIVDGCLCRAYPIIDWFSDSLPKYLVNPTKLTATWTNPQTN